jgi:hypothetical protein
MTYTIKINLFENNDLCHSFEHKIEDSFNSDEFSYVVDMFENMIEFVKQNFDVEETYEMTAYIFDDDLNAIY